MICDAIIPSQPALWLEDKSFLLWEIGQRSVIEHWMDALFRSNATLRLWLEEPDELLFSFVSETFPLNRRVLVQTGAPSSRPEACTFLDSKGGIIIRKGPQLTPYLPRQAPARTWFAMVRNWLLELQTQGSQAPELEHVNSPARCVAIITASIFVFLCTTYYQTLLLSIHEASATFTLRIG